MRHLREANPCARKSKAGGKLATNNRGFAGPTRRRTDEWSICAGAQIGAAAFRQRRSDVHFAGSKMHQTSGGAPPDAEHRTRGSDFSAKPKNGPLARSASRSRLKTVWASRPLFRRSEKGVRLELRFEWTICRRSGKSVPFCRREPRGRGCAHSRDVQNAGHFASDIERFNARC